MTRPDLLPPPDGFPDALRRTRRRRRRRHIAIASAAGGSAVVAAGAFILIGGGGVASMLDLSIVAAADAAPNRRVDCSRFL